MGGISCLRSAYGRGAQLRGRSSFALTDRGYGTIADGPGRCNATPWRLMMMSSGRGVAGKRAAPADPTMGGRRAPGAGAPSGGKEAPMVWLVGVVVVRDQPNRNDVLHNAEERD